MKTSSPKVDIYTRLTDKIVAALEAGDRPWCQPWCSVDGAGTLSRPLRLNGISYRGNNILLLWAEAQEKGYCTSTWMTYMQAKAMGANVRKGEHGTMVVYANTVTGTATDDRGDEVEQAIPFLKVYTVFNIQQIENLPADLTPQRAGETGSMESMEEPEAFFWATGASFRHGGGRAF
jgi:antirestriction protein ArdC